MTQAIQQFDASFEPVRTTFPVFDSKGKDIADLKREIIQALRDISSDPQLMRDFREFIRKFHRYSLYNTILIYIQCPHASQVAGYKTWKKVGRFVRQGERGISIFAPLVRVERDYDDDSGEMVERKILRGFRVVRVFDYVQTESIDGTDIEIPVMGTIVTYAPEQVYTQLLTLAGSEGIRVTESAMEFRKMGATDGKTIWVNKLTPVAGKCATLLHELAHVFLQHSSERRELPRNRKEIEAECAAFLASLSLGIPRGSKEYIDGWGQLDDESLEWALKASEAIVRKLGVKPNNYD